VRWLSATLTGDHQTELPSHRRRPLLALWRNRRHVAATLLSVILLGHAAVSLVFFVAGGDVYINQEALPDLVVVSGLRTLIAFGSLILSVSQISGARRERWRTLRALWALCLVLILIEWVVSLGSSG
jgi:hypothetical protein